MAYSFFDSEIYQIEDESEEVKRFYFKVPDEIPFHFKAGQFVMLDLPIASKLTNRSYSIASAPESTQTFELCIKINRQGIATPWLWEHAKVGMKIKCTTPLGKFMLPDIIDQDICFVATGAGIAPLRSMILDIYKQGRAHKNIYLVFGNRWQKDILYREEFERLELEHPEFHFFPVLSRETKPGWVGEQGYVHPVYERLFADGRKAWFYLCGWSTMVKEAKSKLKERGYTKAEIKFELYD